MQVEDANNETAGLLGLGASGRDCLWLLQSERSSLLDRGDDGIQTCSLNVRCRRWFFFSLSKACEQVGSQ